MPQVLQFSVVNERQFASKLARAPITVALVVYVGTKKKNFIASRVFIDAEMAKHCLTK